MAAEGGYLTHLCVVHTEAELQQLWTGQKLQKLLCSTRTSSCSFHPRLQQSTFLLYVPCKMFVIRWAGDGSEAHFLKRRWCWPQFEQCAGSASLRRCRCSFQSVLHSPACWAGEIRPPAGAGPGPAQLGPPTGSACVWFCCRISGSVWAHWKRWRSRWGKSSVDCVELCTGWTADDLLLVLHLI